MSAFTHQNRRTRQRNRASEKDNRTFRRERKQLETPQYKNAKSRSAPTERLLNERVYAPKPKDKTKK